MKVNVKEKDDDSNLKDILVEDEGECQHEKTEENFDMNDMFGGYEGGNECCRQSNLKIDEMNEEMGSLKEIILKLTEVEAKLKQDTSTEIQKIREETQMIIESMERESKEKELRFLDQIRSQSLEIERLRDEEERRNSAHSDEVTVLTCEIVEKNNEIRKLEAELNAFKSANKCREIIEVPISPEPISKGSKIEPSSMAKRVKMRANRVPKVREDYTSGKNKRKREDDNAAGLDESSNQEVEKSEMKIDPLMEMTQRVIVQDCEIEVYIPNPEKKKLQKNFDKSNV